MPARKQLQTFLDSSPVETKPEPPAQKPKRVKHTPAPRPPKPQQFELTLPTEEDHAVRLVSFKIPVALFNDIDYLRSRTKITATDIFVKSAAPQVARLLDELKKREEGQ